MIDYKIEYCEKFIDNRGHLVVFLKNSRLNQKFQRFGQIYFVSFASKGVVRGNHYHKKWREWFGIITGKVLVKLKNIKTKEETVLQLNNRSKKYALLEIGPYIAHSFKSLTNKAALLNYASSEWSDKDDFSEKLL